ncbi:MAG: hydrogenase formation protein HypD [Myxococcota bacterium]
MRIETEKILEGIRRITPQRRINIMEVCGTHTVSIAKSGLKELLPENIRLVSGPGCPVCVTPQDYIDKAIWLSNQKDIIITTFGDLMRVPGTTESLSSRRASGSDIRVLYSPAQAIDIAKGHSNKIVVFLAVGFETTIPAVSGTLEMALRENIKNLTILCAHKTVPIALEVLATSEELNIDGFILPGHVSTIIGIRPYEFLAQRYQKGCAISGFEPEHILEAIFLILNQIVKNEFYIANQYKGTVDYAGNKRALSSIEKFFEPVDSIWRGIGNIPQSGLRLKKEFAEFDIETRVDIPELNSVEPRGCKCGDVLKGLIEPENCPLFGKVCTYENPVGACMVSSEGSCAAYYRYRKRV